MFVERRKDNYDELQILAGDVRTRRRRANFWTTGLLATTMGATAAYIATTNSQVDALKTENTTLTVNLGNAEKDRDKAQTERDIYLQYVNQFGKMYPTLKMGDAIRDIKISGTPGTSVSPDWPSLTFSNLVWYVDGNRRFPMAAGDVLWIPEGGVWVRLEIPPTADATPTKITIHKGANPSSTAPFAEPGPFEEYDLSRGNSHSLTVNRGGDSRATLRLGIDPRTGEIGTSQRDGFGNQYVDMEIAFTNGACP